MCRGVSLALASIPYRWGKCILAINIWPVLLVISSLTRFIVWCGALPWVPHITCALKLLGHRSVLCVWTVERTLLTLLLGTIGFVASYWAVRKLYSAIRVD